MKQDFDATVLYFHLLSAVTKQIFEQDRNGVAMEDKKQSQGHAEHTQSADALGLPGKMRRPIKVTMTGAGSGFCPTITRDIIAIPGNVGGTIALVDLDADRLDTMHKVIGMLLAESNAANPGATWQVIASTNRAELLPGSDYIVNSIEVSGIECVRFDNDIPAKYGIDQCIGDTIGPGGLFKALRTVPVWLDILHDVDRLAPNAITTQLHQSDEYHVPRRRSPAAADSPCGTLPFRSRHQSPAGQPCGSALRAIRN